MSVPFVVHLSGKTSNHDIESVRYHLSIRRSIMEMSVLSVVHLSGKSLNIGIESV